MDLVDTGRNLLAEEARMAVVDIPLGEPGAADTRAFRQLEIGGVRQLEVDRAQSAGQVVRYRDEVAHARCRQAQRNAHPLPFAHAQCGYFLPGMLTNDAVVALELKPDRRRCGSSCIDVVSDLGDQADRVARVRVGVRGQL